MTDQKFLLYARLSIFRQRLAHSRAIIKRALSQNDSWCVAVSGGKDSTCLLDLVRQQAPQTPAVSSIQEWCLPETTVYLARLDNLERVASGSDHNTGWSPNWQSRADIPPGVKWLGGKGQVVKNYGRPESGVFLGTRIEESSDRKKLYKARGSLFFHQGNQTWQCSPLAEWSVLDIWAYILSHKLDYNRAYDRMREIGLPLEQQRIGPLAIDKVLGYGQLAILKRGWPELFNQFAAVHPEAREFV
jgi:3'-phosphoadenosine 5'-phosphosulfate sulfotransferase (PAPS reductase)/FAD synthetase